ncbi:MAG: L,D-transpeptidase family protein [Rhizobiales bacterium]|nr:L,D-transpeptidase family protein [Hyphomicrobiales bacterium]
MRNDSTGRHGMSRGGFDRVLMAVAATFLTVSASNAFAQTAPAQNNAAELAIDAAVPVPDTSIVPPPTAADITATPSNAAASTAAAPASADKTETTASTTPATAPAASVTTPAAPSDAAAQQAKEPAAAPAAQEPAKTASKVAPADQPVADKLRDTLQTQASKFFDRKNERAAVEKFYAARDYAPLWTEGGTLTARAKSVVSRLNDAAADGLNPAEYPVPNFGSATGPDALAEADLKLTASMLDYARQAQSGQMHWSQVSADIQYPEHPVDPNEVLANISTAKDASMALQAYNPPQKLYKELRAKLAELRGQSEGPVTLLPDGPKLSLAKKTKKNPNPVAMEDARVPQLRAKLGVTENPDDTHYDATVAAAVRKFQAHAGLKATGVLDDHTVKAINSPKRDREIDTIVVNMERWRWLPRQLGAPALGNAYAILNIPDFTLKVMHNGAEVWKTRVVVGKPGKHATPLLTETMKYITVNPTWNVPPSIINNEYLPALQQDPTVLDRMGLKLQQNRDGTIHISQPPGERNALGRIRFNFPNKFLVYQHDTPDKNLFSRDVRAFSHGCMRVQNPDQYASVLLNIAMPNEHYTPEKIRSMYGNSERDIKFATPIPVNITYQTAFVDDAGKLHTRSDIYGRDSAMLALLRNSKNKNLEAVVAHAQPNYSRPRAQLPVAVNDRSGYDSGPNFFERLFGIPTQAPPPAAEYGQRRRIYR